MPPDPEINYNKEAFLHPWNLTFLIVAMLSAFAVSLTSIPGTFETVLLFSAAMELLYLGYLPRQERFRKAVRSRRAAEHSKPPSQKEVFQLLTKYSQRRYARLKKFEKEIRTNYSKLSYASQGMLDSHLVKINGLLESYLSLLYQKERYEYTTSSTVEADVVRAISVLREDMADDSPRVRAIKARRLRILEQRLERSKKGAENMEIIEAQLATVEDVVMYIHEQSLTLRNPEEITFQLDTLLSELEETQASVEAVEEVFAQQGDLLEDIDAFDLPDSSEAERNKGKEKA